MTYREAIEYLHSLTDYEKRRIERYAPDTLVIDAARLMRDRKIGGLPVMDGLELVGIVTETDLLDALIKLLS